MRPLLFKWRSLTVYSYPAMLYVGLVLGVFAGNLAAHAAHMDPNRVYVATLVLIVPALAGSRLLYVASKWGLYRNHLHRIWDRHDGGGAMYGGLVASLLVSVPVLRALHLSFPTFWDVAVFTILVGIVFTRIGCLLNGCCAGRVSTSWLAVQLPNHRGVREPRIPTQILEAAWAAALFVFAIIFRTHSPFPGALFLLVALGYAGGRWLMEFSREREPGSPGFNLAQAVSLAITLLCASTLTVYWRQ